MIRTAKDVAVASVLVSLSLVALATGCRGGAGASSVASPGGSSPSVPGSVPAPPTPSSTAPVLTSLSPASVIAGGDSFTLTINGSNLTSSAVVQFFNTAIPATFVSSSQVTVVISAPLIATAEVISVTAQNQSSSQSNFLSFRINNPAAQITSLTPSTAMAGSAPLDVTVNGLNFVNGATLGFDGNPLSTNSVTGTQLHATIPVSLLTVARTAAVTVVNPQPTVGSSNAISFTVTPFTGNSTPTVISASDATVPAGWPGFQLTVYGTNFVAASVLQWDGLDRPTTVVSSTELKGAIGQELLGSPGTAQATVFNPAAGVGSSGNLPVQIVTVPTDAVGVVERSDIADDLTEPDGASDSAVVSGDGRYVVFSSNATNLIPAQIGDGSDSLFFRDTCIGAPTGCTPSLMPLAHAQYKPAISASGRYVAFSTIDAALWYDTCAGAAPTCVQITERLDESIYPDQSQVSLSADGRFAVFISGLVYCGDWDYGCDFEGQLNLADTCAGVSSGCTLQTRTIGSLVPTQIQIGDGSVLAHPAISPDGRYIVFNSSAQDLDIFDSCPSGAAGCSSGLIAVSAAIDGTQSNGESWGATLSAGGRYVVFLSRATNLVPGITTPNLVRIFVRDTCLGASSGCTPATAFVAVAGDRTISADEPSMSADGRYIAFTSAATDLVSGDTNGATDVFVRDTCAGVSSGCGSSTTRVSIALDGTQGTSDSLSPSISAGGRYVVFVSASKLGPGALNVFGADVYLARH